MGTEVATGGWIASYAHRLSASAGGFGGITPSFFWAGLLIGRAAAPAALRRVSETALVLISLFVAGAGLIVIQVGSSLMTVSSGAVSGRVGTGRRLSHYFCDLHPAFGETGAAADGIFFVLAGLGGR